ncbi:YfhD family protein [Jeotgalibacillus malaysiensis]|uniref:YfhD family protein n=1 Tax=Jeotgalibacillus malaysiensis TaxID=1508404 RepID=UPI00384F021E
MSRSNHQTPSKNKRSLPQTPKGMKVDHERNRTEEFAQELGLHGETDSGNRHGVNKGKQHRER